ncbi:isochorismatase family protein [Streptomyces sp. NRRL F-5126]|uniref:isochorismatase family protein n=1 Tax=Streptomyces sp. NRRL F-5126 TaxID=1463857 RepID=UPI0004C7EC82|nr:isochorismatase family protein [Streptomyces sp. NRRL F-5126]
MSGIPTVHSYRMPTAGDLPSNTAPWVPDPRRAVLLVHDMQRYFVNALPSGEPRDQLIAHAARLRGRCAASGIPVAYTAQPGGMDERQRGLLRDFWGPGMRTGLEDRQIVDALAPAPGDRTFTKWRYSAFVRSDLLEWIRASGRDQLVLCGVYAHVGVLMTAVEAFSHDIETFLVADAVADFSEEHHRSALRYAAERCAVVLDTDTAVDALGVDTGAPAL